MYKEAEKYYYKYEKNLKNILDKNKDMIIYMLKK